MKAAISVTREHIDGIINDLDKSKYFLLDNSDTSRAELFNFALALGLKDGHPTPLATSVSFVRTSYVENMLFQYKSIFYDKYLSEHPSEIDDITDTDKALYLAEQYANTGFYIIKKYKDELEDETHLMTKLLNELDRDYKKYFEEDSYQYTEEHTLPIAADEYRND